MRSMNKMSAEDIAKLKAVAVYDRFPLIFMMP